MTTLNELFEEFLSGIPGQSAASQRNYRQRLSVFLARYGRREPRRIERRHVNHWHAWLITRDLAPATMAGYRQAMRAFCNWLTRERYIDRNPADHLRIGSFIPARQKLPSELGVERITNMVLAWLEERRGARASLLEGRAAETAALRLLAYPEPWRVRDAAIWLLCRGCGPRSQEVINLRLSAVHAALARGPVDGVYWTTSRGKTGETVIRFDERTAEALRDWLQARPDSPLDYCFITTRTALSGRHRPLTRSALAHSLTSLAREAGVAPILTHALRHRVGHLTTRAAGPKVAAMLLNHRDAATAATAIAFYHHPDEADVNAAVAGLG